MNKTIGIIGGMGPAATLDLLRKIYASSSAECDQQHLRVLADIDPTIPDRTVAVLSNRREKIVAHLLKNAQGLVDQGAEMLAMPCNTAHAFLPDLERELSVPFVSIVSVTVEYILRQGWGTVGLMATDGTLAARLYIHELKNHGIQVILPGSDQQSLLMRAIYNFKGGEQTLSAQAVCNIYASLLSTGAQQVVAACTELPIMLEGQERVVDPTFLLAKHLVQCAVSG